MIVLNNISKKYSIKGKSTEVLKGISLTIDRGELVAITGASGSRKSTLLNILGMIDIYSSGSYKLNDIDIKKEYTEEDFTSLRNKYIGFIFQDFHLVPFKTAIDNVALPLFYRKVDRDTRTGLAKSLMDKLGLKDKYDNLPNELSGGQKQRVAIARALITNPLLILADEPTGALDSKNSKYILDILKDLNHKENRTTIIVTHDKTISDSCNRNIRIIDGKIV